MIADRVQKKYVLLAGLFGSGIVSLGIAITLTLGLLGEDQPGSWWILAAGSLLQGSIMGLMIPSRQAIIAEIVSDEELMNAISLDTMGMNALRLTAPALTGFLIDLLGFQSVYYTMTGMYFMGTVFLAFMPLTGRMTIKGGNAVAEIAEGFKYIKNETTILLLLLFTLVAVMFSMPYMMMMPIFADSVLKVGASGMGVLVSIGGIGAIIGSLLFASLPNKKRGLMLLASSLFLGVSLASFSASTSWPLSLVLMVFVGFGQSGRMTLGNTLIQYYVEDEYRGRVMSVYMMEFGLTSFGTFAAGILAEKIGAQWSLGGFAGVLVIVSLLAIIFIPRIRKLD